MRILNVNLGDGHIVLHHIQRAMTQQLLKREHIAAGAEKLNGKRMTKPMRMNIGHARLFTQAIQQQPQAVVIHAMFVACDKQWGILIFAIFALHVK